MGSDPRTARTHLREEDIAEACVLLESGRAKECLELLDKHERPAGGVAASFESVCRAILAEAAGANAEADRQFECARELGMPLAALLRVRGRYHKKFLQTGRAFECYSMLEALEPGAIFEFWQGLNSAEKPRYAPWTVGRMLNASPPRLYPLQPTKAALVATLGPEGAASVYSPMYRPGKSWRLRKLRLDSLMDYARAHAHSYEELIAPRDVVMSTPAIYRGPQLPDIAGRTRSVFLCVLPDIVVSSKSNLLLARDRVLMDYQGDEITRVDINLDADPIVLSAQGGLLDVLDHADVARPHVLEEAFALVGHHTWNFGHWILEFMFKVWLCMDKARFASVPLVIDEQMPAQLREMLELFVGAKHPVVVLKPGESARVGKLWCCSSVAYWPGGDKPGRPLAPQEQLSDARRLCALLRSLSPRLEVIDPDPSDSRRLYLRRKDDRRRRMVNRPEVEAWFQSQGFELVDLADLTFHEQLRRIRGADCIVGPDGAAFYGLLFARPGTRIGMLAQPALEANEWWNQMYKELGLSLLLYVGTLHKLNADYPSQSDVMIDIAGLSGFLDELLQGAGQTPPASLPPLRIPPIDFTRPSFASSACDAGGAAHEEDQCSVPILQESFAAGRYAEVLRALQGRHASKGPVFAAIEWVTLAAMARARSDAPALEDCIDRAYDLGVPLAMVLRECGRHYLDERADFVRAYECFSTLEQLEPGSMDDLFDKLPPKWLVRFAPAVASCSPAASTSVRDAHQRLKSALLDALGEPGAAMVLAEICRAQHLRQN
jgi:hypothetical protein